jgi:cyclophilin family peptidyl-prolyl cis-trans isomerase
MTRHTCLEPLEPRIAPALVVVNPLADLIAGGGSKGASVELGQMFDPFVQNPGRTLVTLTLNLDADPLTPGIQRDFDPLTPGIQPATIVIELFDNEAPLTVQNFLRYLENPNTAADYIGTFFHRLAAGFVLQGGGFNADRPDEHIEVFGDVRNEFSPDRSNVRGTLAMARTELSPNSATSEWFINLADNSENLDNQNGGFTVFGQIISGMEFIDRIAEFANPNNTVGGSVVNAGGALGTLPVQNFTPGSKIRADNLIQVENVSIQRPQPGDFAGVVFSVDSIVDATTGLPRADLLTASINASTPSKLNLSYLSGASGVVNITVKALDTSDDTFILETFSVTLKPNLDLRLESDTFSIITLPGESGKLNLRVINNGGVDFSGAVTFNIYLSVADGVDQSNQPLGDDVSGRILDVADDFLLRGPLQQTINVPSGSAISLSLDVALPQGIADLPQDAYRFIVTIEPVAEIDELFDDDDESAGANYHAHTVQVGVARVVLAKRLPVGVNFANADFGTRVVPQLTYAEPDGDLVTFRIKGAGSGQFTFVDGTVNLDVRATNLTSVISTKASGRIDLHNVEFRDSIRTVKFGGVDTTGFLSFSGGIRSLTLGDVSGDARLSIGFDATSSKAKANITLGRVTDLGIESLQPIGSLRAIEWLDSTGEKDSISAPSIGSIQITGSKTVRGDFEASVQVNTTAKVGQIKIAGFLTDSLIQTAGSIGKISVGGAKNSTVLVGAAERPSSIDDFTAKTSLGSFVVRGIKGLDAGLYVDSLVAALRMNSVKVRDVATDGGEDASGFLADKIGRYKRADGPGRSNLDDPGKLIPPGIFDPIGDNYAVRIL